MTLIIARSAYFGFRTPVRPPVLVTSLKPEAKREEVAASQLSEENRLKVKTGIAIPGTGPKTAPPVTVPLPQPRPKKGLRTRPEVPADLRPLNFQMSFRMKIDRSSLDERIINKINKDYYRHTSHYEGSWRNFGRKPRYKDHFGPAITDLTIRRSMVAIA